MMRHVAAVVLVALVLWPKHCAAQTDNPGPVRVGDRWSYDLKDTATGDLRQTFTLVVFEVNDKEIIARSTIKGAENRPQTAIFNLNWGLIDNGVWQYRPSEISINQPLQVGKEWRYDVSAKNMRDGSAWNTSGGCKSSGSGKGHDGGGSVRHVSNRSEGATGRRERSKVLPDDTGVFVCACCQPLGEEDIRSALRRAQQGFCRRGADQLFSKALAPRPKKRTQMSLALHPGYKVQIATSARTLRSLVDNSITDPSATHSHVRWIDSEQANRLRHEHRAGVQASTVLSEITRT